MKWSVWSSANRRQRWGNRDIVPACKMNENILQLYHINYIINILRVIIAGK